MAKTRAAWGKCVSKTSKIKKAIKKFVLRQRAEEEKRGIGINMQFGSDSSILYETACSN